MKKFKPPTIEEVRAYIKEKGYYTVDAEFFMEFFEAGDWHDSNDKPVKRWKQKVVTWHRKNLEHGKPSRLCYCGQYGVYTAKDDTGQLYWRCEDHKPKRGNCLPKELTDQALKDAKPHIINVNNERNRQKDKLGIK
jgi:hypothetical protein